jgi:hypothetical protein
MTDTTQQTTQPEGYVQPDGTLRPDWLQAEPFAEVRDLKSLTEIENVPGMAQKIFNLEKALGKKRAILPEGPEDRDGLDALSRQLGWPESPEGYPEVKVELPEGMAADPEIEKTWRQWAHEARLTPQQMEYLTKKTIEWNVNAHNQQAGEQAQKHAEATTELKNRWGAKFDSNRQLAQTAAAAFADQAQMEHFKEAGYLADPAFLTLMHKIGEAVSPDRLNARSDGRTNASAIERRLRDLQTSKDWLEGTGPRHDQIHDEIMQLREQLSNAG